jgi:nucleoside-diphosphate-sugar epimerase
LTCRVLVTGASGFVGLPLCLTLARAGHRVRALTRRPLAQFDAAGIEVHTCTDIATVPQWPPILDGVDTVIHLGGRAHLMSDGARDSAMRYRHDNVDATIAIARAAVDSGVRRFVFMSTIKVFGDGPFQEPLAPWHTPRPNDDYGRSKLQAEDALRSLGQSSAIDMDIVRPPLVYGPGVRANFLRLMNWVERGLPLPLAGVRNQRSLVSVFNLNDFLRQVVERKESCAGTWHVSDGQDCSISQLIRDLALQMSRPARLFRLPSVLLRTAFTLAGRKHEYDRLCGSLQVDMNETIARLAWHPPLNRQEGLARTVAWYKEQPRSATA